MTSKVKVVRGTSLQAHFFMGGCVPIACAYALADGHPDDAETLIRDGSAQMYATGHLSRMGAWHGGIASALDLVGIRYVKRPTRVKFSGEYENGTGYWNDISVMRLRQTVAQCIRDLPAGVSAIFRSSKSGRRNGHAIYFDGKRRLLRNGHMRERIDWVYELVDQVQGEDAT